MQARDKISKDRQLCLFRWCDLGALENKKLVARRSRPRTHLQQVHLSRAYSETVERRGEKVLVLSVYQMVARTKEAMEGMCPAVWYDWKVATRSSLPRTVLAGTRRASKVSDSVPFNENKLHELTLSLVSLSQGEFREQCFTLSLCYLQKMPVLYV